MIASLRKFLTCSALALPLVACGDDGGGTDTDATASASASTTSTTDTPTTGSTTDVTTTDPTTTDPSSTTAEPETSTTDDPGTTTDDTTTGDALSWEMDVFPEVVEGQCSCHAQGSGGLTMNNATDSFMNIVDVDSSEAPGFRLVAPGDAANSYLLAKLSGTAGDSPFNGTPSQMPLGAPALSADLLGLVEQWIDEGAAP